MRSDLESRLADDGGLARLARRLVRDADRAEDVLQDARVAAWRQGGRGTIGAPGAWLAAVVKNLAREVRRGEGRRAGREAAAARPDGVPSSGEIAAELETRARLAEAVAELPEPLRTTIFLRFFRGRSLARIARISGVAVSTAHGWEKRGLECLRRRLEASHGGGAAWAVALLPLAKAPLPLPFLGWRRLPLPRVPGPEGLALGGIALTTTTKIALVSLLVGTGAAGVYLATSSGRTAAATPLESAAVAPGPEPALASPPLVEPAGTERAELAGAREERAARPAAPADSTAEPAAAVVYRGRVVDVAGSPVPDVAVGLFTGSGEEPVWFGRSDAGGAFRLDGALVEPFGTIVAADPQYELVVRGEPDPAGTVVVLAPRLAFGGRVVDAAGAPVEGAELSLELRQVFFQRLGVKRPLNATTWTARSGPDGAFAFDAGFVGEGVYLEADASGFERVERDLPALPSEELVIVLGEVDEAKEVGGIVVDARGEPVADAWVAAGSEIQRTGPDGRFRVPTEVRVTDMMTFAGEPPDLDAVATRVIAAKAGFLPAQLEWTGPPPEDVVLRLEHEALAIRGRVVGPDGEPRAGVGVWVRDPTPLGYLEIRQGEFGAHLRTTVEDVVSGGAPHGRAFVTTDDEGRFAVLGLSDRDYDLGAYDPRTLCSAPGRTVAAGRSGVEIVLGEEERMGEVKGRLVSLGGEPLPGIELMPLRSLLANDPADAPQFLQEQAATTTGEDGAFRFARVALDGLSIRLQGERIEFFQVIRLDGRDDLDDLELAIPLICDVQIELGDRLDLADAVRLLDADGEPVRVLESFGAFSAHRETADLREGRSSVLQVAETACTLVLLKGEVEVARQAVRLRPGELTVLRP